VLARLAIFCLYVFGLHTQAYLAYGGTAPFPFIIFGLASLLAAPLVFPKLAQFQLNRSWPMLAYLMFAVLVTAAAAQPAFYMRSFRGILQLFYSVGGATCLYFLILSIPRHRMSSVCLMILVLMAVASLLEFLGPLRDVSDSFRMLVARNLAYSGDERDVLMHGAIRCKVFSPEPSTASTSFFWISMLYFWSATLTLKKLGGWFVTAVIMTWTVRSPGMVAALACAFVTICVFQITGSGLKISRGRSVALLGGLAGVGVVLSILGYSLFSERVKNIMEGDVSFTERITGALQFAFEYDTKHPIIGTGVVGDLEMLTDQITTFFNSIGMGQGSGMDTSTASGVMLAQRGIANNVAVHFIYFGGLGGIIAAALLLRALFLSNRWLWALLPLHIFVAAMATGGYNSALIWSVGFSLAAAARLKSAALRSSENKRSRPKAIGNVDRNAPLQTGHSSIAQAG
jgi:hypothetical protein